jgi:hypothetical protein
LSAEVIVMLDRNRPVVVPSPAVSGAWSRVVCTSEFQVARAVRALVERTGAKAAVLSLPPADHSQLVPVAEAACARLAALASGSSSGEVRVRLKAAVGDWGVAVDAPTPSQRPKATRLFGATAEPTFHQEPTVRDGETAVESPTVLVVEVPSVAGHSLGLLDQSSGRRFRVRTRGLVLGRSPGADLSIDDPKVSRRHCAVTPGSGCLVVRDLGSRNGTWVGDLCTAGPTRVEEGDVIIVGESPLTVVTIEARR